jgi:uracil phosphoribosyltransferase
MSPEPDKAETIRRPGVPIPVFAKPYVQDVDEKFLIDLPSLKGIKFDGFWTDEVSRTYLQESVPFEQRRVNLPENVTVLSDPAEGYDYIGEWMNKITALNSIEDPDVHVRLAYQKTLSKIFRKLSEVLISQVDVNKSVFFPPLRGADLVSAFLQAEGVIPNPSQIVNYELKRDYATDAKLPVVGIKDKNAYPEGKFESAIFIDDCLASDVSASASIDLIKSNYPKLENENIVIVVSAATQRGVEALIKEYPGIRIIVGTLVYSMNESFYLMRTPQEIDQAGMPYKEGIPFVGDMGAWAEKLPDELNDDAPWNGFRTT